MTTKIFYSWQSDLPNNTNRGFISAALENVAEAFRAEVEDAERELKIDSAVKGIVGSVNIADTIMDEINNCAIFIADVSIIGEILARDSEAGKSRRNPGNPGSGNPGSSLRNCDSFLNEDRGQGLLS